MTRNGPWLDADPQWAVLPIGVAALEDVGSFNVWSALDNTDTLSNAANGTGVGLQEWNGTGIFTGLSGSIITQFESSAGASTLWDVSVIARALEVGRLLPDIALPPWTPDPGDWPDHVVDVESEGTTPAALGPLRVTLDAIRVRCPSTAESTTSFRVRHVDPAEYVVFTGASPASFQIHTTAFPTPSTLLARDLLLESFVSDIPPHAFPRPWGPHVIDFDSSDLDADGLFVYSFSTNRHEEITTWPILGSATLEPHEQDLQVSYQPARYRFVYDDRTPLRGRQRSSGVSGATPMRGRNNAPAGLRGRQDSNL